MSLISFWGLDPWGLISYLFQPKHDVSKQPQLRHFEHRPRPTMPYRVSKHGAESLDMTQTCPTRMLKIARNDANWHDKMAQNCSKVFKIAQSCLQLLKVAQNVSKLFQMSQNGPTSVYRGDVLAYTGAKVVITWHCCCRCLLLHGLKVSVNCAGVIPAATFRPLNRQFQLTGITCH